MKVYPVWSLAHAAAIIFFVYLEKLFWFCVNFNCTLRNFEIFINAFLFSVNFFIYLIKFLIENWKMIGFILSCMVLWPIRLSERLDMIKQRWVNHLLFRKDVIHISLLWIDPSQILPKLDEIKPSEQVILNNQQINYHIQGKQSDRSPPNPILCERINNSCVKQHGFCCYGNCYFIKDFC